MKYKHRRMLSNCMRMKYVTRKRKIESKSVTKNIQQMLLRKTDSKYLKEYDYNILID